MDEGKPEKTFRLMPGSIRTIGRATGADFIVDAPLVSRVHCRLTVLPDGSLEVRDLDSTNGTFINGRRASARALPLSFRKKRSSRSMRRCGFSGRSTRPCRTLPRSRNTFSRRKKRSSTPLDSCWRTNEKRVSKSQRSKVSGTPTMWILRTMDEGKPEKTFRLMPGSIRTIGRATGADFIVDAPLVSRVHCRLTVLPDGSLEVRDLDSTNGTFINGRRIETARLVSGDRLGVGRVELVALRDQE